MYVLAYIFIERRCQTSGRVIQHRKRNGCHEWNKGGNRELLAGNAIYERMYRVYSIQSKEGLIQIGGSNRSPVAVAYGRLNERDIDGRMNGSRPFQKAVCPALSTTRLERRKRHARSAY